MSYVIVIEPGTERCRDFFNYLSSEKYRESREWPENFGLTEAINAGVDDDAYSWYVNDLQTARSIERVDGADGEKNARFRLTLNDMQSSTPHVIEAIARTQNREGHSHIRGAFYEREDGKKIPVCAKKLAEPYEL